MLSGVIQGTFNHKIIKQDWETQVFPVQKRGGKYAEAKLSPTHSCSPGAYLVVDRVAARYANVYQTIAD